MSKFFENRREPSSRGNHPLRRLPIFWRVLSQTLSMVHSMLGSATLPFECYQCFGRLPREGIISHGPIGTTPVKEFTEGPNISRSQINSSALYTAGEYKRTYLSLHDLHHTRLLVAPSRTNSKGTNISRDLKIKAGVGIDFILQPAKETVSRGSIPENRPNSFCSFERISER